MKPPCAPIIDHGMRPTGGEEFGIRQNRRQRRYTGQPDPERPLVGHERNEEATVASYEGYCVKCREKREFDGQEVELANGRRAAQGTCPVCGTKMNRILGKK